MVLNVTSSLAFLVPNKSYEGTKVPFTKDLTWYVPSYLRMKVTFEAKVFHLRYDMYDIISRLDFFPAKNSDINFAKGDTSYAYPYFIDSYSMHNKFCR